MVVLNEIQVRKFGFQYKLYGQELQVVMVSGIVRSWGVKLSSVKVGEISVSNVVVVVIEGQFLQDVLFGMIYLEYVKLQEYNSVLLLEKKF